MAKPTIINYDGSDEGALARAIAKATKRGGTVIVNAPQFHNTVNPVIAPHITPHITNAPQFTDSHQTHFAPQIAQQANPQIAVVQQQEKPKNWLARWADARREKILAESERKRLESENGQAGPQEFAMSEVLNEWYRTQHKP